MNRRERAQATLNGLVNDWVAEAQRLARDVVALTDEADATAALHAVEVEAFMENAAALRRRMAAAEVSAGLASLRAEAAEGEYARLRARIRDLEFAGVNLSGQIVEVLEGRPVIQRDQRWVFRYGAGDVIGSFRKAVRSDDSA